MPTEGKVKTLFVDKERTEAIFPRTKVNAVSTEDGIGLDAIISSTPHFSNADSSAANVPLANAETLAGRPASEYATKDYVTNKTADFATESFVTNKIANAQLSGGGQGNIDLSGYATQDDLSLLRGQAFEALSYKAPSGLTAETVQATSLDDLETIICRQCGKMQPGDVRFVYVETDAQCDFFINSTSYGGCSFLLTIYYGDDAFQSSTPHVTARLTPIDGRAQDGAIPGHAGQVLVLKADLIFGPNGFGDATLSPYNWIRENCYTYPAETATISNEDALFECAYEWLLKLPVGGTTSISIHNTDGLNIAGGIFRDGSILTIHRFNNTQHDWAKLTIEGPFTYYAYAGSTIPEAICSTAEYICCIDWGASPIGKQWVLCNSGDWEWKNPPMLPGCEYRTAERHRGYPVYAQLVNFGTLPNNTTKKMAVFYGANSANGLIRATDIISITPHICGDTNDKEWTSMPFIYSGNTLAGDMYYRDDNYGITVRTQRDLSNYHALFTVKYTKEHA